MLGAGTATHRPSLKEKLKTALRKYPFLLWLCKASNAVLIRAPSALFREICFLARSLRILWSFDLLIINGGGQLTESWGGPWKFPYTVFKWVLLARLAHAERMLLNLGAGPLTRPLSKYFVRSALRLANYVSFRDDNSRALARHIGFHGTAQVFPDSAYGLDISALNTGPVEKPAASLVGLAPMAYCDPRVNPENDPAAYDRFILTLGAFGSRLIRENYSLALFCSDIGIDPPVIEDLERILRAQAHASAHSITSVSVKTTGELLSAMSAMDYVVTCRFHGVVFAHMLNKPMLALSHHPKVATLMNDLGMAKYCVDIRTCDAAVLTDRFLSLVHNRAEIRRRMAEKLASYERELADQFDALFPPEAPR